MKQNNLILKEQMTSCEFRRGSILVFSLLILSLMLISAIAMSSATLSQQRATKVTGNSSTALQNADRGVELFLQSIYHESNSRDDLNELTNLSRFSGYTCTDGHVKAALGASDFELVFYTKVSPGKAITEEVDDCDVLVGDITSFKIIGEYGGAARALQLNITENINRGLVARWAFEDNAEAKRVTDEFGSPVAKDASNFEHILTLCPSDMDDHDTVVSFDRCPKIEEGGDVDPPVGNDEIKNIFMDHGGQQESGTGREIHAWRDGIVHECFIDEATGVCGLPNTQAIYFNGTSTYLTINNEISGTANYMDDDDSKLNVTDGLTISLWINKEGPDDAPGILVKNGTFDAAPDKHGYALGFLDDSELQFRAQGATGGYAQVRADYPTDGDWHHVVVTWDKDDVQTPEIYIDGAQPATSDERSRTRELTYRDLDFMVGGIYGGDDEDKFEVAKFGEDEDGRESGLAGFEGRMDDLRIYNRSLTPNEIKELCTKQFIDEADRDSNRSKCNLSS